MKHLSIGGNLLRIVDIKAFQDTTLKTVETRSFHISCLFEDSVTCDAIQPWYFSCADLLPENGTKLAFIVISIFVLFLNMMSGCLQIVGKDTSNKTYTEQVVCINLHELLSGIYLCIIWVKHLTLENQSVVNDLMWRSGAGCNSASAVLLCYNCVSPVLFCLLSLSRLMIVVKPLDTEFKETKFVRKCLFYLCILGYIICVAVTVLLKHVLDTFPIKLCIPFTDPSKSSTTLLILEFVVLSYQGIAAIVVAVIHCLLIVKLTRSQENIQKSVLKPKSNVGLKIQLLVLTSSNFLCWYAQHNLCCVFVSEQVSHVYADLDICGSCTNQLFPEALCLLFHYVEKSS